MSNNSNKKTLAKANGLKSTFIVNDKVYLTSFGKGNKAILEKEVVENSIADINTEKPNFSASIDNENSKKLQIKGRYSKKTALAEKPTSTTPRQDAIGAKSVLEKIYFGKEFNDNLHIQICYNILDIYKILSVHVNNATFVVNNLIRNANYKQETENDTIELINNISCGMKMNEDKCQPLIKFLKSPYATYFGDLFVKNKDEKDEDYFTRSFIICAFLGSLRQSVNHYRINVITDTKSKRLDWLFNLSSEECLSASDRKVLNDIYQKRFSKIKSDFISTSGKDVEILHKSLMKIFPQYVDASHESFNEIAKSYFDFIELKTYKNIGFSIKKLRETILEIPEANHIKAQRFDSVRARLYRAIDFIMNYYFAVVNPNAVEDLVNELRSTISEENKEMVYKNYSNKIWKSVFKNQIRTIEDDVLLISKDKKAGKQLKVASNYFELPDTFEASDFTKLMYLLTNFLDAKEINDLLTTLSSKFSNIASLLSAAKDMNIEVKFVDEYKMFNNSETVGLELDFIRSIARKKSKVEPSAKKRQYLDALDILGIPNDMSKEELNSFVDEMLKVYEDDCEPRQKLIKHDFRNFIARNVINSSRFNYIMRYNSAKETREFIKNKQLVKFVLSRMDEKQIDRYYSSCHFAGNVSLKDKINKLATTLQEIDFTIFKDVNNRVNTIRKNDKDAEKKAIYQTVVSLYLTVLYHIVKNLIYVNSRYVMAFCSYQRDIYILKQKYDEISSEDEKPVISNNKVNNDETSYLVLPEIFLSNGLLNKHFTEYEKTNYFNLTNFELGNAPLQREYVYHPLLKAYRNNVAHLSVITLASKYVGQITRIDSYFSLYHSIMQNILKDNEKITEKCSPKVTECFRTVEEYNYYSKDLLNMLNIPFSYNISRCKSLSIADLFDRNNENNEKNK